MKSSTVWERAQATTDKPSVIETLGSTLGGAASASVEKAVKGYLDTKGDARIAEVLDRVKLMSSVVGISLSIYLLTRRK